jgi:hypothetical protein
MNIHRTRSYVVFRSLLQATAELSSIALFGAMIALWALILSSTA